MNLEFESFAMYCVLTGETNLERIQSNAKQAISGKFPLYCLGFGFDVNFEFLEKMSLQNNGVARRIYEDSDADLQLKVIFSTLNMFCCRHGKHLSMSTLFVNRVSMKKWPLHC